MNKYFLLFPVVFLLIFSCKKAENIGQDLLPDEDFLNFNYTDTFVVSTKTVADEPLRTDKLTGLYLGTLNSTKMGKSTAKIMFELSNPLSLPADSLAPFTIDSAVLFLKYIVFYGDTLQANDYVVKKLNANIAEDQIYNSNQTGIYGTTEIGRVNNLSLNPTQAIRTYLTDSTGTQSVIRIPMNTSFAQEFVNKIGSADSVLHTFTKFDAYFRGIEVSIENASANTMALINLNSLATKFSIFYRDANGTARELTFPARLFTVSGSLQASSINNFEYTNSTTTQDAINSTNQTDSVNYIIGQSGTLNKITLPDISTFQNAAFNRAELLVTQLESNIDTSQNPTTLYLIYKDNSGEWQSGAIGSRDSILSNSLGQKVARYSFNITKLLNDMNLNRITTREVYLSNHYAPITQVSTLNSLLSVGGFPPTRIIVGGSNSSDPLLKTKLRLYYSKK